MEKLMCDVSLEVTGLRYQRSTFSAAKWPGFAGYWQEWGFYGNRSDKPNVPGEIATVLPRIVLSLSQDEAVTTAGLRRTLP